MKYEVLNQVPIFYILIWTRAITHNSFAITSLCMAQGPNIAKRVSWNLKSFAGHVIFSRFSFPGMHGSAVLTFIVGVTVSPWVLYDVLLMARKRKNNSIVNILIGFSASGKWREEKTRKECRQSGGNCLSPDSLSKIQ